MWYLPSAPAVLVWFLESAAVFTKPGTGGASLEIGVTVDEGAGSEAGAALVAGSEAGADLVAGAGSEAGVALVAGASKF